MGGKPVGDEPFRARARRHATLPLVCGLLLAACQHAPPPKPATPDAGAEQRAALDALADFHQRFVRLHPFKACNQALAMNLVNAVLARVAGAGMPHLVLDHVALRWAPAAYRRLFALAARQWCVEGAPAVRLSHLLKKKAAYFTLVAELGTTRDADEAAVRARTSPEAARLALLDFG